MKGVLSFIRPFCHAEIKSKITKAKQKTKQKKTKQLVKFNLHLLT